MTSTAAVPPPPPGLPVPPPAVPVVASGGPGGRTPGWTRRLYRSTEGRIVGGVAQGLARHLGVEPWIVRLAFVLLALSGGAGVAAYETLLNKPHAYESVAKIPDASRMTCPNAQ